MAINRGKQVTIDIPASRLVSFFSFDLPRFQKVEEYFHMFGCRVIILQGYLTNLCLLLDKSIT